MVDFNLYVVEIYLLLVHNELVWWSNIVCGNAKFACSTDEGLKERDIALMTENWGLLEMFSVERET